MKNVIELIKARRESAKDAGFSLLELVVAVGILLVLTVGGLLAYNGITDNARKAAVDSAASEIYTAGQAYLADNDSTTTFGKAAQEWVDSSQSDSGIKVFVTGEAVTVTHESLDDDDAATRGSDTPLKATEVTKGGAAGE